MLRNFNKYRDYMEDRVNAGIEQNRKGFCAVELCDADGKPVTNAKIKAVQKDHEFRFGANIFMLDELETEEKNQKYREYFKEIFNIATLPFYWDTLEPEKGKPRYDKNSPKIYRRPSIDSCIEYCEENGIEPREHALAYAQFFPEWLRDKDSDTIKRELSRRMREISERYADKIPTIEVTNESYWDPQTSNAGRFALYRENDYIEWSFKEAEKMFPGNKLCINDWADLWATFATNRDPYYMQIERALAKGARIDAIGMQYHMFFPEKDAAKKTEKYYNPHQLFNILDLYSQFNLPIQITEITVPAYSYEAADEELQAEILRILYRLWFSHPNVEQIIYWNVVDGYAAFAPQGDMTSGENYYRGGLIRFDFTKKPAFEMLKNMIHKEWHTECECTSTVDGLAQFKGFYGKYTLEIEHDGKTETHEIDFSKHGLKKFKIELGK